ncbi:MAG: hypothetical protein O7D94_00275 [Planctomycetota bacterium]|nr:hypothetical protein [Planctomycetota bacterium]
MRRPGIASLSGLVSSSTFTLTMLGAAGIEPSTERARTADESNPKGYVEADVVKQLGRKNEWVEQGDGHVVKVVAQLTPYLPQKLEYRVIFMDRDIEEILRSPAKMLEQMGEQGGNIGDEQLAKVFQQQLHYRLNVMARQMVLVLKVAYADVISDPSAAARQVAEFMGNDLDAKAMASAVDPSLYRQRKIAAAK